ncbi:cobyrinate a,c-diamide synthase [Sinorhizobium medicae]|uniref:cobyrinate a,c-diamide synthase n=1 Tax=Sinorhizobium medicae TaxID=110321 RepID=UPI002AF6B704|nr:cobyrinate a,c-diamide synthase [Sinorhizobium medicae]WQO44048.1 cobyrinate a,c-diamide synthase [Sinorhizobium medicae]WQO66975.1 cobyrinate a,c-diamide synthase [Sinorhizobium medicae]WQO71199.1 cobyrinate a,c-diamide synthase [Sinorhizobium medicae]WQO90617.1 cobyrinate a,c-diamide synthase [Sinorhizobium medicae]
MKGIMIAAPSSGSGKTTVTLGLMRALKRRGVSIAPGKAGPDYIDPAFHTAASGKPCLNYDPWAMRPALLLANAAAATEDGSVLIMEAMMGLYDGAADGTGAPADLASALGLAVILVVDCARLSHSVAALVGGYARHRDTVHVAGVILNRVGSDRHEGMLRDALAAIAMPVFGVLRQDAALKLPERHLGLVQAGEHGSLEAFIDNAATSVASACDIDAMLGAATPLTRGEGVEAARPVGQRTAVARDVAFAFCYEHLLAGWRAQGCEITFFSPLADEAPHPDADAIYLPGGYPELHAERLASAAAFRIGMHKAASAGTRIFGECGGYMTLGEGLVAADGGKYEMLGLLPLVTSFAERKRHLGYRHVTPLDDAFFRGPMTAHEFHYATIVSEGTAEPLFAVRDAAGVDLGRAGLRRRNVAGSFMHLIDLSQ